MIAELREASLTPPLSFVGRAPGRGRIAALTDTGPARIDRLPQLAAGARRGPVGRSGRDTTRARHGRCRLTPHHHESWLGAEDPLQAAQTRCRDPHRPTSRPKRATGRRPVIGRMVRLRGYGPGTVGTAPILLVLSGEAHVQTTCADLDG